jgi:FdhE protein
MPDWDAYDADFQEGVPLLQSAHAGIDLAPAGRMTSALIAELAAKPFEERIGAELRAAQEELRRAPDAPRRFAAWLLGDADFAPSRPGLLRYVGWVCAERRLRPLLAAFAERRNEERWLRNYCPACASPPSMAQLVGIDPGRMRFLVCGSCATRWRYSRTGCPFCAVDTRRIAILAIEGEGGLRIDHCDSCRGYLKTYDGQGAEALLLADWSSLHLDVLAQDRGLVRRAASSFDFDPNTAAGPSRGAPR